MASEMPDPAESHRVDDVPDGQELVRATCPVCDERRSSILASHPHVVFVACSRCGAAYRRSHAVAATSAAVPHFAEQESHPRYSTRRRRRVQKSRHQILDLLNHCSPGPLLDVGCSVGSTLLAARQLGLPAVGVDVRVRAVGHCRALGFRAETGSLESLPFRDGEFQLVMLKHVLEHTPTPRDALREVRRVLGPGGGVFIAVPHGGYRKARRNPQHHEHFSGNEPFGHYVYYEPASLARLLTSEGFRVVRVHPHLMHGRAGAGMKLAQAIVAPFRLVAQRLLDALRLRKEFWLCAVRTDAPDVTSCGPAPGRHPPAAG